MNQQYSSTTENVGFAAYFLPLVSYSPLFFCTSPGYINSLSLSGLFPAMQLPDKEYMVKFLPLPIPYAQTSVCPRSTNVICLDFTHSMKKFAVIQETTQTKPAVL